MDNPEQYLVQVLRRTYVGLQDSLLPLHAEKCLRLIDELELAPILPEELARLKSVSGFTRAAIAMEWVLERVRRTGEEFSPETFEIDATMLNDRLFEAFLNEPFDAPPSVDAGLRSGPSAVSDPPRTTVEVSPEQAGGVAAAGAALATLLDTNLLLGFERFAGTLRAMPEKGPEERRGSLLALKTIAKNSTDMARAQGRQEVYEFFRTASKFLHDVEAAGLAESDSLASVMNLVGDRLELALANGSNGVELLTTMSRLLEQSTTGG